MQESTAEKLNRIQSLFDAGKTHAEIAKELGYKNIKSYYHYIYNHGDSLSYKKAYDRKKISAVPSIEPKEEKIPQKAVGTTATKENVSKAETIILLISRGMDLREIAKKKHFNDEQSLADYMRSKGYKWDSTEKNYILLPQEKVEALKSSEEQEQGKIPAADIRDIMNYESESGCDCLERYGDILKLLSDNRDKLVELLSEQREGSGNLPRYVIPGTTIGKTFNMVQPLKELIIEFSEEYNVQQKDIFAIAMIDFFKKYGYSEEVKMRLKV